MKINIILMTCLKRARSCNATNCYEKKVNAMNHLSSSPSLTIAYVSHILSSILISTIFDGCIY